MELTSIIDKVHPGKLLKAANAAAVVLIAVLGLLLAGDIVVLALGQDEADVQAPSGQATASERRYALSHYSPILENNVFGFPGGKLRPLAGVSLGGGQPRGITLRGTVAAEDGSGFAIVEDGSGRQFVYEGGDYIEGVGTLGRIKRDSITVEEGGRDLQYELAGIIRVASVSERGAPPAPSSMARRTAGDSFVVDREAVREAFDNPEQIMTDARLLPNVINGRQEGFVMNEVKQGGVFHSLGLRDGDVLTRLNSFTLDTPESALQAMSALGGMEKVELDITRNGQKLRLTYVLR